MNCYDNMIIEIGLSLTSPGPSEIKRTWKMKERKEISIKVRRHNSRKLPLASVTITQMSQICALSPPHCVPELSPCAPLGVREDGLSLFLLEQCGNTRNRTGTKTSIIELCLRNLEPAADTLEAILPFLF